MLDGLLTSNQFIAGYRTQIYSCDTNLSSKKHSKNLSVFKDVVMYHDTYVMKANNVTTLSGIMLRGNYLYLKDRNLINNAQDYYILLGRSLFQFEKTGIIKTNDIQTYLRVFEDLIIDVELPTDYYSHRRKGAHNHNQDCFLEEKDTGDYESTAPFNDLMKQVPMEFVFPAKGQSLASSGQSVYQIQ